ncbi:uncharacterized protein [Halyomorpha halys]|uniref:uncharacterized protein n=1 Tax=Halyomorpha halys TaxID=286706 RepID=UPI0034D2F154
MYTKAIHFQLVSSLTTDAFLAALDRFVARRGLPRCIHSDNGTNFVRASKFLKEFYSFFRGNADRWVEHFSPKNVEWRFIPPHTPNFGGLREAGVKTVKTLLTSVVGGQPLIFKELNTVLVRIEGMLNSRPLCPMRDDSDDFNYLSPGHFLIGAPLECIPLDIEESPRLNLSSRWRLVQQSVSHVWSRWQRDYLHQLQQRTKWTKDHPGPSVGDLVVMIENCSVPGTWPIARIAEVFPGKDGVVRVISMSSVVTLIAEKDPEQAT